MSVVLMPKAQDEYFLTYDGSTLKDYENFRSLLDTLPDKYFDNKHHEWVCGEATAQKVREIIAYENIGRDLKLKLYAYQREAVAFCLKQKNKGALIILPCGAGKTPIGLSLYAELRAKELNLKGVIVVKASLKEQWLREVQKFTDFRAHIVPTFKAGGRKETLKLKKQRNTMDMLLDDAQNSARQMLEIKREMDELEKERRVKFLSHFDATKYDLFIINYETLTDEKVRDALFDIRPDFWFVDEIDCIKNTKTQRSKAIYNFNVAKYRFGATATPIRQNPKDIFGILKFVSPDLFPDEKKFEHLFLKIYYGRITGSKNEEALSKRIAPYIFQRSFDQIASQLPMQLVYQQYCELTGKQIKMNGVLMHEIEEYRKQMQLVCARVPSDELAGNAEYRQMETAIIARQNFAQMLADSPELLTMSDSDMAQTYATCDGSPKLDLCMSLLEKIVVSGEKVCVFSKYLGIQDILRREIAKNSAFEGIAVDSITGFTDAEERLAIITEHNTNDNHRVLLLSDSGEAGLNLSKTKYLIEYEPAESAAKQTQRRGRIQRADSVHKNVVVFQLIARNSYDEIALKIISKKQNYMTQLLFNN
jgi:SNF2 family DNA or RNA helicase